MGSHNLPYPTSKEYEFMIIIWESKEPLSSGEILVKAENRTWSESSLHPLINNLLKKGFIEIVGSKKAGKTNTKLYAPCISIEDYTSIQLGNAFGFSNDKKGKISEILSFLIDYEDKNEEDSIYLDKWIKDLKAKFKKSGE